MGMGYEELPACQVLAQLPPDLPGVSCRAAFSTRCDCWEKQLNPLQDQSQLQANYIVNVYFIYYGAPNG